VRRKPEYSPYDTSATPVSEAPKRPRPPPPHTTLNSPESRRCGRMGGFTRGWVHCQCRCCSASYLRKTTRLSASCHLGLVAVELSLTSSSYLRTIHLTSYLTSHDPLRRFQASCLRGESRNLSSRRRPPPI
jgi:hypothetical protein